jgi:hypothetical protein
MITNLDQALKLLKVKDDDPDAFIAINRKAAEDLSAYIGCLHEMILGVEEGPLTRDEFHDLLVRLCPDAEALLKHTVGIGRTLTAVAEHIFVMGSGAPEDIAKFRHQLKYLEAHGKLDITE